MANHDLSAAYTMLDFATLYGGGDNYLPLVNNLVRTNQFLENALWVEANRPDRHLYTEITQEPKGSWSVINKGNAFESAKGLNREAFFGTRISWSVMDSRLLQGVKDKGRARSAYDAAHSTGIGKSIADAFVYGNTTMQTLSTPGDTGGIDGLKKMFYAYALDNVSDAGGSTGGSNTSVFVVAWGPETAHLLYRPGGKPGGVNMEDLDEDTVYDSDGNPYRAYLTRFEAEIGICVPDSRAVQVVCNINPAATGATRDGYIEKIIDAITTVQQGSGEVVLLMNRSTRSMIQKSQIYKVNVNYQPDSPFGPRMISDLMGVPIKIMDTITNSEDVIAA